MGFWSKLFSKIKGAVKDEKEQPKKEIKEVKEDPKEKSGLNEEMVSESVELEPAENNGLPEIFEKAGEEEPAKEEQKDGEPEENKPA